MAFFATLSTIPVPLRLCNKANLPVAPKVQP